MIEMHWDPEREGYRCAGEDGCGELFDMAWSALTPTQLQIVSHMIGLHIELEHQDLIHKEANRSKG